MATLEKIRKRSVLLIVIIGAALLAFILGDALNNGRTLFGSGTTVAELGDANVDITEYQQRVEMYGNQDNPALPQQAIDELIDEKLIDEAADKLGIEVSDAMVTYFVMDIPMQRTQNGFMHHLSSVNRFINAYGEQFMQVAPKAQENITDLRYWYNVIFTPEKYNVKPDAVANMKQGWLAMEKQSKADIRRMLYGELLTALMQPNALEKQKMYAERTDMTSIDYAFKPFPEDLSAYKVTDNEIKDEYEKTKNKYRLLEDTKTVGVLAYHITPSDADRKNAEKVKADALKALSAGAKMKDLPVTTEKMSVSASSLAKIYPNMVSFLENAPVDSIGIFDNDGSFELVKMTGNSKMANDGAQVAFLAVKDNKVQDIKNELMAGVPVDTLVAKNSPEEVSLMNRPQMNELQNPAARTQLAQIAPDFAEKLDTVSTGAILDLQNVDGATLFAYVMDVKPQVPVYDIEIVSYTLYPSKETIEKASADMAKYASANNTPAKFAAGAAKAGYSYINEAVTASTPGFKVQPQDMRFAGNGYYSMPGNKIVAWAMNDAEPGNVSEVVYNENNENPFIYIAMVENEYEDFIPYTDTYVKTQIEKQLQARKAGDAMVKQFSGKGDITATAEAMETVVIPAMEVSYTSGGRISEKPVLARIAAMQPSDKVVLIKGDKGVYAVVVKEKKPSATKMSKDDESAIIQAYKAKYLAGNKHRRLIRGNERKQNRLYEMTSTR